MVVAPSSFPALLSFFKMSKCCPFFKMSKRVHGSLRLFRVRKKADPPLIIQLVVASGIASDSGLGTYPLEDEYYRAHSCEKSLGPQGLARVCGLKDLDSLPDAILCLLSATSITDLFQGT